jgi:hypothetical protein
MSIITMDYIEKPEEYSDAVWLNGEVSSKKEKSYNYSGQEDEEHEEHEELAQIREYENIIMNHKLEIKQLKDELELMKKKEEERLQDNRDLFNDASNSLKSACATAIEKLVQTTLSKAAQPVMAMIRNHEDNQTTSLFPDFDPTQQFEAIPVKIINQPYEPIRKNLCQMLSNVLLPKETIIACVPISKPICNNEDRFSIVCHQLFTSLGRQADVRYNIGSYLRIEGFSPIESITGDPLPLTSEYIEIIKMYNSSIQANAYYRDTQRTDFFDKLLRVYKTHYPLASDMQKNDSMIKDLKLQQSVTTALHEDMQSVTNGLHEDMLTNSKILEDKQTIYEQEKNELDFEKKQLKKRLQAVAKREKESDIRHNISNIRSELIIGATTLLDACDTVENEIIERMVERAIGTINSILK